MPIKHLGETLRHCVHYAKGKKRETQFTHHLFLLITVFKTIMLLIIFLGLIAKLNFPATTTLELGN
jgi:hypothetical protein